jgi:hypothetical protein
MKNAIEIFKSTEPELVESSIMSMGDIAIVVRPLSSSLDIGEFLIRSFDGWMSLNNPRNTWDDTVTGSLGLVRILPPGTEIKITVRKSWFCARSCNRTRTKTPS